MRHSNHGERRGNRRRERMHGQDSCDRMGFQESHGGRGGRGGRKRILDGGQLRLLLLTLISEQARHGYDLIREIEARSGGVYAPSPGVIYPTLTLLLDMGLIEEQEADGTRKLFGITETGTAHLAENEQDADATMDRIAALAERQEQLDPAPVRRAMQNLKTALQNRLSEEGIDKETILSVAGLVDEAASKIERL